MKANIRCFPSDETALQSFMVIMAHCRITTISLSHSLRFVCVHPAEQRPFVCFIFPNEDQKTRAHLRYGSAGRVLMRGDCRSWDNYTFLFVC